MIRIFGDRIPNDVWVACSGGADSMCAAHFLARKPYRNVRLLFVHHGTDDSQHAQKFLEEHGTVAVGAIELRCEQISTERPPRTSPEEHWRNERYAIFKQVASETKAPIITAHHLDDCIETYLFKMLHGKQGSIAYRHGPVIRPFLMTRKSHMENWCIRNNVFWIEDQSNKNTRFMRNYIRQEFIPKALHVNPGLHKVVARITSGSTKSCY